MISLISAANMQCPTDETLALFAAGECDAQTGAAMLAHIECCNDCMAAMLAAEAQIDEEQQPAQRTSNPSHQWWLGAAAAAAILALIAIPVVRDSGPSVGRLAAVAPASQRAIEPRLAGFRWAPYRAPSRSAQATTDTALLQFDGAAGDAIERAGRDHRVETQHAAGVAMVLVEKPEQGAAQLESAAQRSHDAKTWSDLAAARYAEAMQFRRMTGLPRALAAADQALRADARLPEALFNRALVLERMGSTTEARLAWERYLQVDAGSRWAAEAREHLAALSTAR